MSTQQLKHYRELAALEALTLTDMKEFAYRVIPSILSNFKSFITHISPHEPAIKLPSMQRNLITELKKHSYLDLAPLHVFTPEGLQTGYKAYCEALLSAVVLAEELPNELGEYKTFISRLMGTEEQLRSTDWTQTKFDTLNNALDISVEKTGECFGKNSTESEMKYGQALQNNGEWFDIFSLLNDLVTRIEKIKRTDLIKEIQAIDSLLDMFQNKIKRNEIDTISPEMITKIADYTYLLAKYLEYYSVTHFRVKVMAESINQSVDKVYKVITRKD